MTSDGDDDGFALGESLGYRVNYLAKAFARELGARLAPHGVSPAQWAVLAVLWAEDGLSQADLSRRVAIEEATMVRTLDRMERDGLVRRERDVNDRRRARVRLTDRGRGLKAVLTPLAQGGNAKAVAGLTEVERRQLVELLRRVTEALELPAAGSGVPAGPGAGRRVGVASRSEITEDQA